jgi:hypothetical protein
MRHLTIFALLLAFFNSFGEFYPGTIVNKNGRSRTGYIEAKLGEEVVRFKAWMEAEEEQVNTESIMSVLIKTDSGQQIREYQYIYASTGKKANEKATWLRLLRRGTVNLYVHETLSHHDGIESFEPEDYFCLREGETTAKHIATYDNNHIFHTKAPLYFADCLQLVEKIKSKQFTWQNLSEVVRIYNQWVAGNKLQKSV